MVDDLNLDMGLHGRGPSVILDCSLGPERGRHEIGSFVTAYFLTITPPIPSSKAIVRVKEIWSWKRA